MSINDIQDEIISEFSDFEDWMDRYALLIDLGNELESLPEELHTEQNIIDGCQSKVWIDAQLEDGEIVFRGDSDAILVKGIVALLIKVLSGHTPKEIQEAELYFIDEIGLKEHLSPTRSNGLVAMLKQMRLYAIAYQAKA
ncbi:MAG: SufE family protein [Bacteroidales bacterium]|nr:SufE family protein [Candidatus Colicola faecequi]